MKVFVAGATGELGRPAVRALVAAGLEVVGVARTDEKAALVSRLGATPVIVDLFDPPALREAVAGCDAVLHLATKIPRASRARVRSAWAENDRLRTEGTRNLVDAALAAGASVFVQESITFTYPDKGSEWIDESVPLADENLWLESMLEAERQVARFQDAGRTGIVLRFGLFYGPEARSSVDAVYLAANRIAGVVGPADSYMSSIHTDDAGRAVAAALGAPAGTYNVVDDVPLTRRDYARALAGAFGFARPRIPPVPLARAALGGVGAALMRSQRVSNEKFRETTGWAPAYASAREGWDAVAGEMVERPRPLPDLWLRGGLGLLALSGAVVALWAVLSPRSFYVSFPGLGRHWVAIDGPYNEHLVRDVGALNLALTLVTVLAFVRLSMPLVRAALVAWVAYGVPHLAYHLFNISGLAAFDAVAQTASLVALVILPAGLLVLCRPRPA